MFVYTEIYRVTDAYSLHYLSINEIQSDLRFKLKYFSGIFFFENERKNDQKHQIINLSKTISK